MKKEYDVEKMNPQPNPYAKILKEQRTRECEEVTFWIKKDLFHDFNEILHKQGETYAGIMTQMIKEYIKVNKDSSLK